MAILRLQGISKRFGSLLANDAISLSLERGEVLALLGENGAGKTTLMNILFGHYLADSGSIEVDGQALAPGATSAAIAAGIGMVHQHFTLAENLSVLDNIMLGTESLFAWRSNRRQARRRLLELAGRFAMQVVPDRMVADLSVGERQRVEILKVLFHDARILILDEPTAVLTPQEVEQLFATLSSMVEDGLSIIFISHKLHEILSISDRVVVLRRGAVVAETATADADRHSLAEMMVGRKVTRPTVQHLPPGDVVLEFDRVGVHARHGGGIALAELNLRVHANEIIGLAGVAGNGQLSLGKLLSGLLTPDSGRLKFCGTALQHFSPRRFIELGIGRIPEDRQVTGVVGDMNVWENAISEKLREVPFWRMRWLIDFKACRAYTRKLLEQFDVRCRSMEIPAKQLSGGNMQKLILARTLENKPKFIFANQPVRGLDEGAIAAVHENLLAAKRAGAGILLVSEDLDELFALADRIAVIYQGRISDSLAVQDLNFRDIGVMMAGDLGHARNLTADAPA